MYGHKETDLVVKYYDIVFGPSGEDELSWYLEKVRSSGGPVLDLGCGTGRLSILTAKEGYEVTGIDQSEGMLEIFKGKLLKLPPDVHEKICIKNRKMSDFDL
ncbi:MAG TPA: methyltransferase domain-containing protein, partial [Anaerolineales bacterium]